MIKGLAGPFSLTAREIEASVSNGSPGTYALGYSSHAGRFIVEYVGAADDLKPALREWVPTHYQQFMFEHYPSARAAFEKLCDLYHFFKPPDNKDHPAPLEGEDWPCPYCVEGGSYPASGHEIAFHALATPCSPDLDPNPAEPGAKRLHVDTRQSTINSRQSAGGAFRTV